jgi:hypothetical protein
MDMIRNCVAVVGDGRHVRHGTGADRLLQHLVDGAAVDASTHRRTPISITG